MNETSAHTSTESSLLLLMLAAAVVVFAAHVSLGWIRETQRQPNLKESWKGLLQAAFSMGTGLSSCAVLALSSEAMPFPLGYQFSRVLLLWGGSMLACLPICYWLMRSHGVVAILGSGVLLAVVAAGVQAGWVLAVGFRPGVFWRTEFVVAAVVLLMLGLTTAIAIANSDPALKGRRRQLWRFGGAAMLGLSVVIGQEVLLAGAGLLAQVSSVYKNHVPASVVCLAAGAVLPLLQSVMAIDLELRRRARRRRRGKAASTSSRMPLPIDKPQTPAPGN
jgi:NO-binding membrane sensor protein with MHYT domain